MKINIRDQLPKYLGEVKLLTTKCCILEVEKLGPNVSGAAMILKQFPVHKCGHEDAPKPAFKCLRSMLKENNPQRFQSV
jgi:U3 small nucleolar RNA-associated protein 23